METYSVRNVRVDRRNCHEKTRPDVCRPQLCLALALVPMMPASATEDSSTAGQHFAAELTAGAAQGDAVAAAALREYSSLSAAEQDQFNESLEALVSSEVDPADIPGVEIVEMSASAPAMSDDGPRARAATASWSAYCSQRVSLMGVVVTETRVDADFDTGGGRVTGIRNQRARVVTNFQPLTTVEFREIRKETGATGTVRALTRVERGPIKGLGSQTENWQSLAVNGSGQVTSCRWGY